MTLSKFFIFIFLLIFLVTGITLVPPYLSAKKAEKLEMENKIEVMLLEKKEEDDRKQKEAELAKKEIERIKKKPPITRQESHSLAIVFTYEDVQLLPTEVEALCNPDIKDKNSLFQSIPWYEDKASDYGIDFNMKIDCFKTPIKLSSQYVSKPGDPEYQPCSFSPTGKTRQPIKNIHQIDEFLRAQNTTLKNYEFIADVHFNNQQIPQCSVAQRNGNTFFLLIKKGEPLEKHQIYTSFGNVTIAALAETFVHESLHLLGATDKYIMESKSNNCKLDSTGKEYPKEEVMCRGYTLKLATVSDATAKEIGWRK